MNAIATEEIFPAEDDFASAVFPGAVLGRFIKGNVTASDSSKDCIEAICATLQEYNFHPTVFTNKANLTKIRKEEDKEFAKGHAPFQKGRTLYLYCRKCFNDAPVAGHWSCSVIATLQPTMETVPGEGDRYTMCVRAIYPHCSQCDLDYQWRRNVQMDREHGGRGWGKLPFPFEEIIGDRFHCFTEKLKQVNMDGEHFGKSCYCHLTFPDPVYANCSHSTPHVQALKLLTYQKLAQIAMNGMIVSTFLLTNLRQSKAKRTRSLQRAL